MDYYVYILFSEKLGKFYTGQTQNLSDRIRRHNNGQETFTSKGVPWELVFCTEVNSRSEALKLEKKIKNFRSQQRINEFIEQEISEGRGSRKIENL
jgi:putative endonuclease